MTEKRYIVDVDEAIIDTKTNREYTTWDISGVEDICDKLNNLTEENEQLRKENQTFQNQYERKDRQLKRTKKDIEKYTDYFMNELNWDCDRIIKEVFK